MRVSSVQSISTYSVARVTSTDPYYSSTASLRQRSSSREGSICSDFHPSFEELVVRKSSYSWRQNFDMDLRSGGNRDDIARGKNREDMARVENSEEMLTNSVTVEKAYEDKNEIVKNDSVESECKPNITSVG